MYIKRLDAMLAWFKTAFNPMMVSANFRDIENLTAEERKAGLITLILGPAYGFSDVLQGQAPEGKQIISMVIQKTFSESTQGEEIMRAELALMEKIRILQNDPNLPPEASGLVIRDIIPSQQAKVPDLELIATFEVQDT